MTSDLSEINLQTQKFLFGEQDLNAFLNSPPTEFTDYAPSVATSSVSASHSASNLSDSPKKQRRQSQTLNGLKKRSINEKRAEQNRQAQRTFRARKENYLKGLEQRVQELSAQVEQIDALKAENERLRIALATQLANNSISGSDQMAVAQNPVQTRGLQPIPEVLSNKSYISTAQKQQNSVNEESAKEFISEMQSQSLLKVTQNPLYDFHDQLVPNKINVLQKSQFSQNNSNQNQQNLQGLSFVNSQNIPIAFGGGQFVNPDIIPTPFVNPKSSVAQETWIPGTPSANIQEDSYLFDNNYLIDANDILDIDQFDNDQESGDSKSPSETTVSKQNSSDSYFNQENSNNDKELAQNETQNEVANTKSECTDAQNFKDFQEIGDQLMDTLCDLMQKKAKCSLPKCEDMSPEQRLETRTMLSSVFGRVAEEAMRIKKNFERLDVMKKEKELQREKEKKEFQ